VRPLSVVVTLATRIKDPTIKTVVFSQFTKFLDVIQYHLRKQGYLFVRLDGTMSLKQRDSTLEAFSNSPKHTIMLASLAVCSVGVTPSVTYLIVVESGGSKSGYFGR
jgi:SWI/SNF-related matrix-associated actin-dependent regulator of chromatin subfamily A3